MTKYKRYTPRTTKFAFGLGEAQIEVLLELKKHKKLSVKRIVVLRGFWFGTNGEDYDRMRSLADNKLVTNVMQDRTRIYSLTKRGNMIADMLLEDGHRRGMQ